MAARAKYYVVWAGREPGIYTSWASCAAQVQGVPGSEYKGFATPAEAAAAFAERPLRAIASAAKAEDAAPETETSEQKAAKAATKAGAKVTVAPKLRAGEVQNPPDWRTDTVLPLPPGVRADAWAVDAACSGNPGRMEYRGVDLRTGAVVFSLGPIYGTNNIGEFLAIVHALALMQKQGCHDAIYSDSRNALKWVRERRCRTTLKETARSAAVFELVRRAEAWLRNNSYENPLLKWDTRRWGEVPADFGRK